MEYDLNFLKNDNVINITKIKNFVIDELITIINYDNVIMNYWVKEDNNVSVKYEDITEKWLGLKLSNFPMIKKYEMNDYFNYKNKKYKYDGHFIKYSFDEGEEEFAKWLSKLTDKQITLMPKINYPLSVRVPDYRIGNKYYDLKTIYGNDKQIIYHKIRGNSNQSKRFIFDISEKSLLTLEELLQQLNKIFSSFNTDVNWVEMIGIRYNDKFMMFKRK